MRSINGHVIAARITAENPDEGFQPTSGSISELSFRNTPNVWGYFSTYKGVHEFSDSQFGHLFAWGANRAIARNNMVCALKELTIRGDIRTTVEYLITLMETNAFRENEISTEWLDGLIAKKQKSARPDVTLSTICGALYKAHSREVTYLQEITDVLTKGQIPPKRVASFTRFSVELILDDVKYQYTVNRRGKTLFEISTQGSSVWAEMRVLADGSLHVCVDGGSHIVYAKEDPSMLRLTISGKTVIFSNEYDPTRIESVMAGKLVRYLVPDGEHVNKGDDIVELEVMKMYISIPALESGVVTHAMHEGSSLEVGDIMGHLTLDDPSMVQRAVEFTGKLPAMQPPLVWGDKVHQRNGAAADRLSMVMAGYQPMDETMGRTSFFLSGPAATCLDVFKTTLLDPNFGTCELAECLSTIASRIPADLCSTIQDLSAKGPSTALYVGVKEAIVATAAKMDSDERSAFEMTIAPLSDIVERHIDGPDAVFVNTCIKVLQEYTDTESLFQKLEKKTNEEAIYALREACNSDAQLIMEKMISHANLDAKNTLCTDMLKQLDEMAVGSSPALVSTLEQLATWQSHATSSVSRYAREMLAKYRGRSSESMSADMLQMLNTAVAAPSSGPTLQLLADNPTYTSPVLLNFLFSVSDPRVQAAAMQAYVLRIYDQVLGWTDTTKSFSGDGVLLAAQFQFALGRSAGKDVTPGIPNSPARSGAASPKATPADAHHSGQVVLLESMAVLKRSFRSMLEEFSKTCLSRELERMNSIKIFMRNEDDGMDEEDKVASIQQTLVAQRPLLAQCGLRTVTVVLVCDDFSHNFYTFSSTLDFAESPVARHIDPALAFQLGLDELCNFQLTRFSSPHDSIFAFYAEHESDRRFFVRSLVRSTGVKLTGRSSSIPCAEQAFNDSLSVLEDAMTSSAQRFERMNMNHIFLNLLVTIEDADADELDDVVADCSQVFKKLYSSRQQELENLRVTTIEIKLAVKVKGKAVPLIFTVTRPTVHAVYVHAYTEKFDVKRGEAVLNEVCCVPGQPKGLLDNKPVHDPYTTLSTLEQKRLRSAVLGGSYAYDFSDLFAQALRKIWKQQIEARRRRGMKTGGEFATPPVVVKSVELMLDEAGNLVEVDRPPAMNKVAMLAWRLTLYTPEYRDGRDIIIIANDITVMAGSFGPKEDELFDKVSKLARAEGLPRIYVAANSGARIGLAEEVRALFKAAWNDVDDPNKGFQYLYLDPADYEALQAKYSPCPVNVEKVVDGSAERYKIIDIVGAKDGLGVECLAGSGLIAGETSLAYDEIFTLTYVMSRSVGIGAYLVRLGQRVIQKTDGAPIILTGKDSLNKLLGRDVYQSNAQLGGIRVMHANGVSHLTVEDDLEGVTEMLNWLAFVPKSSKGNEKVQIIEATDPIERSIDFVPPNAPYDPRDMLRGVQAPSGKWVSGFFDQGSFIETLAAWAKNVVVGRARLGGIPLGCISVEARTVDKLIPADPADETTQEVVQPQAAQVWFPDSSYKTATAIADFNREQLPLMIFANWRGFSGGTRDMFDEILKFGSYIVDALVGYKQPVLVYIPRHAELRGGAWVVVDRNINSSVMEMFADTKAAGGVLEAEGTVVVKYRKPMLLKTMHRVDATLKRLDLELGHAISKSGKSSAAVTALEAAIEKREKDLFPIYKQLSIKFAELHDTPGRMMGKGVIDAVVPWESSRKFFYWRLRRRIEEKQLRNRLVSANPDLVDRDAQLTALLRGWFERWEASSEPSAASAEVVGTAEDLPQLEASKAAAVEAEDYDTASRIKRQIDAIRLLASQGGSAAARGGGADQSGWANDRRVIEWLEADEADIERKVSGQRRQFIGNRVVEFGRENVSALAEGLQRIVDEESPELSELLTSFIAQLRGPPIFSGVPRTPSLGSASSIENLATATASQSSRLGRFHQVD